MSLADPTDPERMYLDAAGAVPHARPIMTGDVFTDVPCSRGGPSQTVMVTTHPCSMRTGREARMRDIVTVATVVASPQPSFSPRRWMSGMFDYLPLFDVPLDVPLDDGRSAVHFTDLHSASSADLRLGRRVLALSDYGVTVLLQRWIYQMSRDEVPIDELNELIAPVLAEAEIQEEWASAALAAAALHPKPPPSPEPDSEERTGQVLAEATARVQEILGRPGSGSLRDDLSSPSSRTTVRRTVAAIRLTELGR